MKRVVALAIALTCVCASAQAMAQTPAEPAENAGPVLEGLRPNEFEALRSLAQRGVAVLVREPEGGVRARITVLTRARASVDTVRGVIAAPEQFPTFMNGITRMEVLSRRQNRIGFRFHASVSIFSVTTLATLHVVNPQRVDGRLLQSDLGPGGLRWELFPDGEQTWIAYSTWGDPSQANWLLRTVARVSPSAIAAMQLAYDALLVLSAARRAEVVAGRATVMRPRERSVAVTNLVPLEAGAWSALARQGHAVGAITLNEQGSLSQVTMTGWSAAPLQAFREVLSRVDRYGSVWPSVREARVLNEQEGRVRFRSVVETPLFRTEGEQVWSAQTSADGAHTVQLTGASGDYQNDLQRWDLRADAAGGTVVQFSGGAQSNRAGMIARAMIDSDPWMLPGYATALQMVWLAGLLHAVPVPAATPPASAGSSPAPTTP